MCEYIVSGGNRLNGTVKVQGAKNSVLPVLAASLLCSGESIIHNCPDISDVAVSDRILTSLGCTCSFADGTFICDSTDAAGTEICDGLMSEMRSSVIFLGAILARFGRASLSSPGGCELGLRPINLHVEALRKMGAEINEEHGKLVCVVPDGLHGCTIDLSVASVGATENIMIAATAANGRTLIRNAAKEPEISDLANYLRSCGADINGDGGTVIEINGVGRLHGCEHTVIPDRIVATTYMSAAAVCGGDVFVMGADANHLVSVIPCFEKMGCYVTSGREGVRITSSGRLRKIGTVRTGEYPGFPTDAQPIMLAAVCTARGTSVFVENIFSNRFRYVSGLTRMGADVGVVDRVAVVNGVKELYSADTEATDLRGGAAMIIAALGADGTSHIASAEHIDRGYERLDENLRQLGAKITKEN